MPLRAALACLALFGLLAAAPSFARADAGDLDTAVAEARTPAALTEALVRRGTALRLAGRFRAALSDLARAAEIAPTPAARRYALGALGIAEAEAGLPSAAARLSEAIGPRPAEGPVAAVAAAHLARLEAARGRAAEARALAQEAVAAAPTPLVRAFALTVAAEAAILAGDMPGAARFLARAVEAAEPLAEGAARDRTLIAAAAAALSQEAGGALLDPAEAALQALGAPAAPRLDAAAEDLRAALAAARGRLGEAYRRSGGALARAQAVGAEDLVFRIARRRAEIARAAGDRRAALAAYRIAFAALQGVRADLGPRFDPEGRSLYRVDFGGFHTDYVALLLEQSAEGDAQSLLAEALTALEDLKVIEIEDYFRERCVRRRTEIGADRLGPDTALLYPVVLEDRLELIVGRAGRLSRRTSPVPRGELEALVRAALAATSDPDGAFETPSRALHDALIAPVAPLLLDGTVETLVYAPDGVLRLFPIAALWDGERFLIERIEVATVLGLTLVEPRAARGSGRALVAGASETAVEGFSPIPGIRDEAREIGRILGVEPRLDREFRTVDALRLLRREPYSIVHIAAHASFGAAPEDNFIALSDGRLDMPRLVEALRARSIERDTPIDLLTLSACQTAQGTDRAPLGLAGAAYRADARSVIASLWFISDAITPELMKDLYAGLAAGESRAGALARAQRRFVSEFETLDHPNFWAAFILVGDWQ